MKSRRPVAFKMRNRPDADGLLRQIDFIKRQDSSLPECPACVGCCLGLARLTVIEYLVARCEDHDSG